MPLAVFPPTLAASTQQDGAKPSQVADQVLELTLGGKNQPPMLWCLGKVGRFRERPNLQMPNLGFLGFQGLGGGRQKVEISMFPGEGSHPGKRRRVFPLLRDSDLKQTLTLGGMFLSKGDLQDSQGGKLLGH